MIVSVGSYQSKIRALFELTNKQHSAEFCALPKRDSWAIDAYYNTLIYYFKIAILVGGSRHGYWDKETVCKGGDLDETNWFFCK